MGITTSREIRSTFLEYFAAHHHQVVPSSGLLPAGDATLLFANAGMNQFKDVFAGREQREYTRACSSQKCVRAGGKHNDLENVGYTARHHTFFEMLGNFSFGDYFKQEAIRFAWELLVDVFKLDVERLWFTVYTDDDEAARLWQEIGAPAERVLRFGESENFWSMGEVGPCGPCSEIHYDRGADPHASGRDRLVNGPGDDIIEIWNLVFMQYDRDAEGAMHPLPRPCVDTGMGLERMATVLQGVDTNYDTDLFTPLLAAISRLVDRQYDPRDSLAAAYRVIADHLRASAFLLTDGITPSSDGRGYVLRRIIRRALRYGRKLGLEGAFLHQLLPVVIEQMGDVYPELVQRRDIVTTQLRQEEERFATTLNKGTDIAQKELERLKQQGATQLDGALAFDLFQTHGLPLELLTEFAQEEGLTVDEKGFAQARVREQERGKASWKVTVSHRPEHEQLHSQGITSRFVGYDQLSSSSRVLALIDDSGVVASLGHGASGEVVLDVTPFYAESGGQVGDTGTITWPDGAAEVRDTQRPVEGVIVHLVRITEGTLRSDTEVQATITKSLRLATQRNHTATHLLHAALHEVLGPAAQQAGSLVNPEHLRFDFNWSDPITADDLAQIERIVNAEIISNHPVSKTFMSLAEARSQGAMALFGEKYGDEVRVVKVADGRVSSELCGGCHVASTGEIGLLKIVSERGVAAGVRRIEALTGMPAVEQVQRTNHIAHALASRYHSSFEQLPELLSRQQERLSELEEQVRTLTHRLASGDTSSFEERSTVAGFEVLARRAPEMSPAELRNLADTLRQRLGSGVVVLGMEAGGKATLLVAVTPNLEDTVHAGKVVRELAPVVGGRGGGRPNLAQAGGPEVAKLDDALKAAGDVVAKLVS